MTEETFVIVKARALVIVAGYSFVRVVGCEEYNDLESLQHMSTLNVIFISYWSGNLK